MQKEDKKYTLESLKEAHAILLACFADNRDNTKFCSKLRVACELIEDAYEQIEDENDN